MSMYAAAIQNGSTAMALAITGDNEQTIAAYNAAYASATERLNRSNAAHAIQLNISAVRKDKILTNASIQQKQNAAAADAKVAAAAAGVKGGSLTDVLYMTEVNEAQAISAADSRARSEEEGLLANMYTQRSAMLAVRDPQISYSAGVVNALSQFEVSDFKRGNAIHDFFSKPSETEDAK